MGACNEQVVKRSTLLDNASVHLFNIQGFQSQMIIYPVKLLHHV